MFCLGISRLRIEKIIFTFETNTLEFVKMQNFVQKKKPLFWGQKKHISLFWEAILKTVIFEIKSN